MQKNKNIRLYATRYRGRPVYAIKHKPSGWRAYFDKDEELKKKIESAMQNHTLYYDRQKDCFVLDRKIRDNGQQTHVMISLDSFIYECVRGITGYRVTRRVPPNHKKKQMDCRVDNLWSDGDTVLDTPSRHIYVSEDGKTIVLHMKRMGVTERMTYSPELFDLITKPANISFSESNQKRVQVSWGSGSSRVCMMLSTVCYAVYKLDVSEQNYRQELPRIKKLMDDRGLEIDHINNDFHNHCQWNIATVTSNKNKSKNDLFTRIKPPYFTYCAVTESGEYRIAFGCPLDEDTTPIHARPFTWEQYYICPTIDDLISFLAQIKELDCRLWGAKYYEKIRSLWKIDQRGRYAAQNFNMAQAMAEKLLSLHEDNFIVFTTDSKLVVRSTFDVA